ncbi:TRAPP trafficking subunit Trs65-domain-containing protein [Amylocarpus encephaloides]|uniref:TRAPP trafficking subunit Trs65-domain-containing protein n=1 Tax=Amylocarpus encephaloides TaxID=45428 RepID=A0A9P7YL06_9HELO|nr:TRAPP trafficking subunit Trs65-domain-containing protein [Amylocarpus encephaloides]
MLEETEANEDYQPRGSLDIVESSVLDTIIPLASQFNIEEALTGSVERLDEGTYSPLTAIPQRQALFFDETVDIYVVLQTPYFDENTLRSYLGRLVINLEAQVVNVQPDNYDGPPAQEIIYTGSVQDSEDPVVVVQGPDESEGSTGNGHILVVWKLSAFLVRPRLRLQNPSMVFSATASLKPPEHVRIDAITEEYLPSQIPSGMNLLEAFSDDPAMGGVKPRLSALRVSQVRPVTQTSKELHRPLKNITKLSIKVYPAINARVRYSRTNTTAASNSVLASLDIDITPFANCKISIEKVDLHVSGGTVEDLNIISGLTLPITCLPQDDVTLLYRLSSDDLDATIKTPIRNLEISITGIAPLASTCRPTISMRWTTSLDFTPPVNPGYGLPTQAIQRPHRPAQLSIGSASETPTVSTLAINRPDALPSVDITTRQQRNSAVADFGVTMTFTAPPTETPIFPGVPFIWSVFVVNRSDRPRKLAITVLPKRRRNDTRMTRPPSVGGSRRDPKIADAVIDENIIHAMQKSATIEPTDLICLSTDTRVGPLAPLACYEIELKLMALKAGIVDIEAVRIIDLGSQEHVDIRDLPSVVVSLQPVE